MTASDLLEESLEWLRVNYRNFRFHVERDVVWTVQGRLIELIAERSLPFHVYNDYPILPGNRRALCVDIALVDETKSVVAAIEFKYEPAHRRGGHDIWPTKFPVVFWSSVIADVARAQRFVAEKCSPIGYAILIDEGGYFAHRNPIAGGEWRKWATDEDQSPVAVHWFSTAS